MTVDLIQGEELPTVWNWLVDDVEAHFDDFGPKTFDAFLEYVSDGAESETLVIFAIRTGKKLVGAVGFEPVEKSFKGIVFAPEVRGSGVAVTALRALLLMLWELGLKTITAKYFITNKAVPGFFRKLGAKWEGIDGHTTQGGVPVQYVKVSFNAPVTPDVQLVTS